MTLTKWFRKNMKMLMAIFVIGILFAFVGGTQVLEMLSRESPRDEATFADSETISNFDRNDAVQELEMLRRMQAPAFLENQFMQSQGRYGLHGLLLSQLIFSDGRPDPRIVGAFGQMIRQGALHTTEKQLLETFSDAGAIKPVYWILLKHEALAAGMGTDPATVTALLGQLAQQLMNQSYGQLISQMRRSYKYPEEQVLKIFGDLLAVLQFAQLSANTTDVTLSQMQHQSSWANETVEAQFVKLEAKTFLETLDPNASPDLAGHFDAYRDFTAGHASPANEHGFGYRLPDRIQLEYLVVKLEDLKAIVGEITQDEKEAFYARNASTLFTRQESADPQDPNLPRADVTDPFAKVVARIHDRLVTEKVLAKAMMILQEARSAPSVQISEEDAKGLTPAQIQAHADDYSALVQELSKTHKVPLHAGMTGLLSRSDANADPRLNRWRLASTTGERIPVTSLLFDVSPLEADDLQLLSIPKPHLFESLGPLQDAYTRPDGDVTGQTMAIVRVVKVVASVPPTALTSTYENTGVTLDVNKSVKTFATQDQVAEDARLLQAYAAADTQAQAFIADIKQDGWDTALTRLNQTVKAETRKDPNGPDLITAQKQTLHRMAAKQLDLYASLLKRSPGSGPFLARALGESKVANAVYREIASDQDHATHVPFIISSPSQQAIYCINEATVKRFSLQAYLASRGGQVQQEEQVASQSLAPVHFSPQNILDRMNYHRIEDASDAETDDAGE